MKYRYRYTYNTEKNIKRKHDLYSLQGWSKSIWSTSSITILMSSPVNDDCRRKSLFADSAIEELTLGPLDSELL